MEPHSVTAGESPPDGQGRDVQQSAVPVQSGQPDRTAPDCTSLEQQPSSRHRPAAQQAPDPTSSLLQVLSFSAARRNNIHMLDDETVVLAVGCVVLLLHMPSLQQRRLPGRDGGGVAAVSVHPSRQCFLVAERCRSRAPNM